MATVSTRSPPKAAAAPCYVVGVGMTKFVKPRGKIDYNELGFEASVKALLDARVNYDAVDRAVACYCYGDSTCGQRVIYQLGMTGIPVYNVNNNCSTGSTGLQMGREFISSGRSECVLVVGFEKMAAGSLQAFFQDRTNPIMTTYTLNMELRGIEKTPGAAQLFGNAGREYIEKFGATPSDLAEIARINHKHSAQNPYSQFQDVYTLEQIENSPVVHAPLTKLQCCPTSDGSAAAVLVSEAFLKRLPKEVQEQAILIAGQSLATDGPDLFETKSSIDLVGYGMSKKSCQIALKEANVTPDDVDVCELHDCFSANELVTIDALGLSEPGKAHLLVRDGGITYGSGKQRKSGRDLVINPSGGLISKGHPLGATGLAQCAELVWHLRGWANNRLTDSPRVALQHNLGLGGAVVCTVYTRPDRSAAKKLSDEEVAKRTLVGYNPATEAKGFTREQLKLVLSKTTQSQWAQQDVVEKVESRF